MELTSEEICKLVNGRLIGRKDHQINKIAPIEEADEHSITFLSNPRYQNYLTETRASTVLVSEDMQLPENGNLTYIRVNDVYSTLAKLLDHFNENINLKKKLGIHQLSHCDKTASIGDNCYIGPFAYIGPGAKIGDNVKIFPYAYIGDDVEVGNDCIVYSGARIYGNSKIGQRCIFHSGCVIGSDGFGFAPQADGSYQKTPQTGNVIIENDVEVGANTTIDRATIKSTIIHEGVKLDNLIQIAHNVEIGRHTVIAAQTGISGSTKIGSHCMIAGQVGIVGHITIADQTSIGAKSGISKSIKKPGQKWHGLPAMPYRQAMRSQTHVKELSSLYDQIRSLKEEIRSIKASFSSHTNYPKQSKNKG